MEREKTKIGNECTLIIYRKNKRATRNHDLPAIIDRKNLIRNWSENGYSKRMRLPAYISGTGKRTFVRYDEEKRDVLVIEDDGARWKF